MILALTVTGEEWIKAMKEYGKLEDANILDYTSVQQMTNFSEPLFRKDVIKKLSVGMPLEVVVDKYVMPLEKERRKIQKLAPIKRVIKKVIRGHE